MRGAPALRTAREAKAALRAHADPERARLVAGYFKTGPGGYAEGDRFLGLPVPRVRALARQARDLPFVALGTLLRSPVHEDRMLALLVLVERARRGDDAGRARAARFYLAHLDHVNNWDLVDLSAPAILGPYLERRPRALLDRLARSPDPWRRRVAMVATQHLIRRGETRDALRIAAALLGDEHDLLHKASGWMLREAGQRDAAALRRFLDAHAARMPRTMLRYATERLPERARRRYMAMGRRTAGTVAGNQGKKTRGAATRTAAARR